MEAIAADVAVGAVVVSVEDLLEDSGAEAGQAGAGGSEEGLQEASAAEELQQEAGSAAAAAGARSKAF